MIAKPIDDQNETDHGLQTSSQSSTLNDVKRKKRKIEQTNVESNNKENCTQILLLARDLDVPIAAGKEEIAPDKSYDEASTVSLAKGPEHSPNSKITTAIVEEEIKE